MTGVIPRPGLPGLPSLEQLAAAGQKQEIKDMMILDGGKIIGFPPAFTAVRHPESRISRHY